MHNVTTVHNNPPRRESQSAWKTVTVTIKSNWQVFYTRTTSPHQDDRRHSLGPNHAALLDLHAAVQPTQ